MTCFFGIDIGTSGTKVVVMNEDGAVIDHEIVSYTFEQPKSGWSEQNPALWVDATAQCLQSILTRQKNLDIACIGLSGQMHGMTALDKNGDVIRPCILWNDQRNEVECDEIIQRVGGLNALTKMTNNTMLVGFTGGKIKWFEKHEPDLFAKTKHIVNPKDYLRYRLTGEFATDVSEASGTGLLDVVNRRWSDELMSKIGIDKNLLPPCYESTAITGYTTKDAQNLFGLPVGIPVVGGGGDAVIQTLGSGIYQSGVAQTTLGTAGIVAAIHHEPIANTQGKIQVSCNVIENTWHTMGVTLCGASALSWWRTVLQGDGDIELDYDTIIERAQSVPIGADGLIYLPYLMGERCPYSNPNARGGFIGARYHHTSHHFNRAVLEGVIFSLKDIMALIMPHTADDLTVYTSGGGASSAFWNQMQADIMGCTVATVRNASHGGALGAAIIAAMGIGRWQISDVQKIFTPEKTWTADRANTAKYQKLFAVYGRLHDTLLDVNNQLSELS